MAFQQVAFTVDGERAAGQQHLGVPRHRRLGRVDRPDEEPQVEVGEGGEVLTARRQEDAPAQVRQQAGGLVEAADPVPQVARTRGPAGAAEDEQWRRGGRAGPHRMGGDAGREGVGGVDDGVDPVVAQPLCEPGRPAEPADAHLARGQRRRLDPPRERRHHPQPGRADEHARQPAGLAGPAQDEQRAEVRRQDRHRPSE